MSSGDAMTAPTYEIKPPAEVLAEDVICQSFIQSSSTLAYACLALRRGRYDLASHVLHSLEQKPASRFKDMVLYLQAQIAIETGDFADVKKRLAARAHQHPNDMVALSLLASAVWLEWEDWRRRNPSSGSARALSGERTVAEAADPPADPGSGTPAYHTLPVPTVASAHAAFSGQAPGMEPSAPPASGDLPSVDALAAAEPDIAPAPAAPRTPAATPAKPVSAPAASDQPFLPAGGGDFGIYQALASDANTQALSLWNLGTRRHRTACKKPGLENLVAALPEALPSGLAGPIRSLEGGEIIKVCFSFQGLTVTSLHAGAENLGLVTGNVAQSLLTMVRAENLFLKAAAGAAGNPGANAARAGAAP